MSDFFRISPSGAFYDQFEMMKKYGFTDEDDLFYEMSRPRGEAHRFDIYQFKRPEIPTNIPERFDFFSFPEVMKHPIILPDIVNTGNAGEVVSFSFVEKMRELGFHDFVTYPVRVHLINSKQEFWSKLEAIEGRVPYRDDLFVMLQLTAPLFALLEPIGKGVVPNPERYKWDSKYYIREDYQEIEYPLFFRIDNAHFDLQCNEKAAAALSLAEFKGLKLLR